MHLCRVVAGWLDIALGLACQLSAPSLEMWSRRPFLPLPDPDWMAFRMTTAYGDPSAPLVVDDVITWLRWSKSLGSLAGTQD